MSIITWFVSFVIKTIVFFAFLVWIASLVIGDMSMVPEGTKTYKPQVNTQGGLIVPTFDTRLY